MRHIIITAFLCGFLVGGVMPVSDARAGDANADATVKVENLFEAPHAEPILIEGTLKRIGAMFILRDSTGTVAVRIPPAVLNNQQVDGKHVQISGTLRNRIVSASSMKLL